MQLTSYLFFNGNCAEAFAHYKSVLGGEIVALVPYAGAPDTERFGPDWQNKIMHARLVTGTAQLMGSDSPPEYYSTPGGLSVMVSVDTIDDAERIFAGLAEGGTIEMPIAESFFAHRWGSLVDRYGISWMVVNDKPMG